MAEKVLGAAIFGAGWVAGEHARAYQACARTKLVAVGSRKEESARKCAEYAGAAGAFVTTDFEALLKRPEVDLVSITTPPDLHAELAVKAARAGKHVCIEKPIALDRLAGKPHEGLRGLADDRNLLRRRAHLPAAH